MNTKIPYTCNKYIYRNSSVYVDFQCDKLDNDPGDNLYLVENAVGKGEILETSFFSFYHNVFYPIKDKSKHLSKFIRLHPIFCHLVKS